MPRYLAFLRAINVGGHNVMMEKLRREFEALGCRAVETFIASGNVIFTSVAKNIRALEERIERQLHLALGYEVKVFIRNDSELAAIARYHPFKESRLKSATTLNVAFLSEPLDDQATRTVLAMKSDIDDFHVHGREVYWLCQTRQSDSKFSNTRFEKALNARATWRNLNTIIRLAAKYPS
jgi:uncharacterized protein (DUF1697 family)